MAYYLRFFVALAISATGLIYFALWPSWLSFAAFVGLFAVGSNASVAVFNRFATPEQVKEDLEARILDT